MICVLHYVDDLGGIHDMEDAESGYEQFTRFCQLLGFRLKPSKAQAPSREQKLLGVIIRVEDEGIRVAPDPGRVQKLQAQISDILDAGVLEPEVASKLAGKLSFVNSTAFGKTGTTALRPIHASANSTAAASSSLNAGLSGALRAVWVILDRLIPRFVPFIRSASEAPMGGVSWLGLGSSCPSATGLYLPVSSPSFARAGLSYFLEIFAQLMAFCVHFHALPAFWSSYVDNQPGMIALMKGYGRDEHINLLLAAFWGMATTQRWLPEFRWVPSELNIADPISRGDLSVARPSWCRPSSTSQQLEAALLQLSQDTAQSFHETVAGMDWVWV